MNEKKQYYENLLNKLERRRLQDLVDENPNMERNLFRPILVTK